MPALEGMRILDMTQYEAGTSCTQMLAWLGADVVKIESPTGDPGRRAFSRTEADSQYFLNYNSNKRSVVLNLRHERGRQLLLDLVPKYDVFVENFGPGVIEKLDIGYEVMSELNSRLIFVRIKGFGVSGPYSGYKSFDALAQAAAGTFSITGDPDGPPMRPGPTLSDSGAGAQTALAIAAAYVQQQRTGKGQFIDISMQETTLTFMRTSPVPEWDSDVPTPRRGNRGGPPSGMYPCAPGGPNDFFFIMIATTRMWDTLCAAIERPDLATDPRFLDAPSRRQHADELQAEIEQWSRERTKQEAMRVLGEAGVPVSAVFDTVDVFNDPHLKARGFIQTVEHPEAGAVKLMASPLRLSESDVPLRAAPLLGQHSGEVLKADLGIDDEELASLREQGVVC